MHTTPKRDASLAAHVRIPRGNLWHGPCPWRPTLVPLVDSDHTTRACRSTQHVAKSSAHRQRVLCEDAQRSFRWHEGSNTRRLHGEIPQLYADYIMRLESNFFAVYPSFIPDSDER